MRTRDAIFGATLALALFGSPCAAQYFDQTVGPVGAVSGQSFRDTATIPMHIDRIEVAYDSTLNGIRLQYSDVTRTSSSLSQWLGSSLGTPATFDVPLGDYLAAVDVYYDPDPMQVFAVTVHTAGGVSQTMGTTRGIMATLSLAGHELVGFSGTDLSAGISSLAAIARPAWECDQFHSRSLQISAREVVELGGHISQVRIREELVDVQGVPVLSATGVRIRGRDASGEDLGWQPWIGSSSGGVARNLSIPMDDALWEMRVGFAPGSEDVHQLFLGTRNGASVSAGDLQQVTSFYESFDHHEIVGFFGDFQTLFNGIGMIQRPIAARSWQTGTGCASTGLEPGLSVDQPRIGGTFGYWVNGPANTAGAVMLSFQSINVPLWNCILSVSPFFNVPLTTDATGVHRSSIPLTDQWYWVGLPLYVQALMFDAGPTSPISLSDSYGMLFGGI